VKNFSQRALKCSGDENGRPKYLVPNHEPAYIKPWQFGARRSAIHVLRHAQPCRGNWDANRPFPRAAQARNHAASAVCGWRLQEQLDNQMKAQHVKEPESVKRHHTAKRIVLILPSHELSVRNQSQLGWKAQALISLFRGMGNPGSPFSAFLG